MFRKELLLLGAIVIAIFLGVATASWFAVRSLHRQATMVVIDTLPGLVDAGNAISRIHENWLVMHQLAQKTNDAERAALVAHIRANSTEGIWQEYGRNIYSAYDRRGYAELTEARAAFLAQREEYLKRALAGQLARTENPSESALASLYERYETAARNLFVYNAAVGQAREREVIRLSWLAPVVVSGLAVLVFVIGVVLGWRFAWNAPQLLSRLQRK